MLAEELHGHKHLVSIHEGFFLRVVRKETVVVAVAVANSVPTEGFSGGPLLLL